MNNDVLIIIAVALGTILTRVLPFLIFNDAENLPPAISYLSKVLPYSIMAMLVVPQNGLLRNPETHAFLSSPFMSGIIFFMMLLFLLPGLAYGIGAGVIKNDKDEQDHQRSFQLHGSDFLRSSVYCML